MQPLLPHATTSKNTPFLPITHQAIWHQPVLVIAQAPAQGITSMLLAWSKLAPYFSGEVNDPIKELSQEYEELADSNGLTSQQKVETIIQYVDPS